ncbi:hypothetical protein [Rhizobium leguminosarum]|uniref:hypothetical protein n=1 Tax=Rhizobium leguminosarum TaxID=384 RepID=UPI003D086607
MIEDSPELWNRTTVCFVQALLGAISPNFRLVALGKMSGRWQLRFILENESREDREEIEDAGDEFGIPIEDQFELEVIADAGQIQLPLPDMRLVYQRREP